jgi:AcrR family transcriptional regulator
MFTPQTLHKVFNKENVLQNKPYHHGNLEKMLIEEGISLINAEGFENFSLRKAAAKCGVSHTAPYKHFPNKEALLKAIQQYVTDQFSEVLENSLQNHDDASNEMIRLGKAYLHFFLENPHYFHFFMSHSGAEIDLATLSSVSAYRPFEIFKTTALKHMQRFNVPKAFQQQTIISMWAMVHGITSMATMNGVHYTGDWAQLLESILKQNTTHEGTKHE